MKLGKLQQNQVRLKQELGQATELTSELNAELRSRSKGARQAKETYEQETQKLSNAAEVLKQHNELLEKELQNLKQRQMALSNKPSSPKGTGPTPTTTTAAATTPTSTSTGSKLELFQAQTEIRALSDELAELRAATVRSTTAGTGPAQTELHLTDSDEVQQEVGLP